MNAWGKYTVCQFLVNERCHFQVRLENKLLRCKLGTTITDPLSDPEANR